MVISTLLWLGIIKQAAPPRCLNSLEVCSVRALRESHSYCPLDPTCVTPAAYDDAYEMRLFGGIGIAPSDPLLVQENPIRFIALQNWLLFSSAVLLVCGSGYLLSWLTRGLAQGVGDVVQVAAIWLYCLEWGRWLHNLWSFNSLLGRGPLLFEWETYVGLLVLAAPFVCMSAGLALMVQRRKTTVCLV